MKVEWKNQAIEQLNLVSQYCYEQYGENKMNDFLETLELQDKRLSANPQMGHPDPLLINRDESFRALPVQKYYKLIYYVDEAKEVIYIVDLWDTRREPQKLTKRIK